MNLIAARHTASQALTNAFSQFESRISELEAEVKETKGKLAKAEKALYCCEDKLKETKEIVVSFAHEAGMSVNDSSLHNATLFLGKCARELSSLKEDAEALGYASLKSMVKAVKMTTSDTRGRKTRAYYEDILPRELTRLPLGVQLASSVSDSRYIEKLLIEGVYPVFEQYLGSAAADVERLTLLWSEISSERDMDTVKNWCLERTAGVREQTPQDLVPLSELISDSVGTSGAYNTQVRRDLLAWVNEGNVCVSRMELEKDWETLTSNSIVHKLVKKYAGCPMHSSVCEAAKALGYLSSSGVWSEEITLGQLAAALRATDSVKDTAKWNTDFVDAAIEAIQSRTGGKIQMNPFTKSASTVN
jgi:hypothetical protein